MKDNGLRVIAKLDGALQDEARSVNRVLLQVDQTNQELYRLLEKAMSVRENFFERVRGAYEQAATSALRGKELAVRYLDDGSIVVVEYPKHTNPETKEFLSGL